MYGCTVAFKSVDRPAFPASRGPFSFVFAELSEYKGKGASASRERPALYVRPPLYVYMFTFVTKVNLIIISVILVPFPFRQPHYLFSLHRQILF